jgi:hypothetical protein
MIVIRLLSVFLTCLIGLWYYLDKYLSSSVVCVARSLVLCVCFIDHCLSFVFFLWPLCCLPFFDLRILVLRMHSLFVNLHIRICENKIVILEFMNLSDLFMRKLKCMMVYELYYFVPGVICFSFFPLYWQIFHSMKEYTGATCGAETAHPSGTP